VKKIFKFKSNIEAFATKNPLENTNDKQGFFPKILAGFIHNK
jgi:hypothetical protein